MRELKISADNLVIALLNLQAERKVCLLDSCGVSNLGSRYLIAGFDPIEVLEINESKADKTLEILDKKTSDGNLACILTISYEFGLKLNRITPRPKEFPAFEEPDIFLAVFDFLIVYDYETQKTFLTGNNAKFEVIEKLLLETFDTIRPESSSISESSEFVSNFTYERYLRTIEDIQESIRCGDTYQTNLTQQLSIALPKTFSSEQMFLRLRKNYPAPFAAFLRRENDIIISASPERFFKVQNRAISVSPIKGTRPRGKDSGEDLQLQSELLNSEKDRAENIMIVDLLRNDIGRICEYGSVVVEKLCDLETHPTLFHLVSTISGVLRENVTLFNILKAVFPCGSITGAPKIRTMQIIDKLETAPRGLSMGAIGYIGFDKTIDLSVAIRTMTVRENKAVFNVGGGIVIDSVPEQEYEESITKAQALLKSINTRSTV